MLQTVEAVFLLHVITDYSHALEIHDQYDHQQIEMAVGDRKSELLTADEIRQLASQMKEKFGAGDLFGIEKDKSLGSSVAAIYQTFDGKELYPATEIKAANLLDFLAMNHSFVDGNKRIAAAMFIWFLHKYKKALHLSEMQGFFVLVPRTRFELAHP
jgi:prophage maintenance system killer protein